VNKVGWGPISHRVLVEGTDGAFRVYDGRDRSWTPLPPMIMAQWSPDENRVLYLEGERRDGVIVPRSLSLLTGRQTVPLCEWNRIGEIGAMNISSNGEAAFLLAGPEAGLQVWMIALPRAVEQPRVAQSH
jgi:hypothetical protein